MKPYTMEIETPNPSLKPHSVWIDLETTGLDFMKDDVLEVGAIILSDDWREIATFRSLVLGTQVEHSLARMNPVVKNIHSNNGLIDDLIKAEQIDVSNSLHPTNVDRLLRSFLGDAGLPGEFEWHGSTVSFDKAMCEYTLPEVFRWFHYRMLDVTTLKLICRSKRPELYKQVPQTPVDAKSHRPLQDLRDSINEYRFYCENLIQPGA